MLGVLVGIVTMGLVLKIYWHRLLKALRWRKAPKPENEEE